MSRSAISIRRHLRIDSAILIRHHLQIDVAISIHHRHQIPLSLDYDHRASAGHASSMGLHRLSPTSSFSPSTRTPSTLELVYTDWSSTRSERSAIID